MKLYELSSKIGILERMMDTDELVDTDEMQKELEQLNLEFSLKIRNCVSAMKNLTADAQVLASEASRLKKKADAVQLRADWLKDYVKNEMEHVGRLKLKTGIFKVQVQANSQPTIKVMNENAVPEIFKHQNIIIDKKAIQKQIRDTGEVPNGIQAEVRTHLRIS